MSISQEEIREFNSPARSSTTKPTKKGNKINHSPLNHPSKKSDVFELFTIKTPIKHHKTKTALSDSQDTSELSDDVFVKPKPVSLSTPSRSDTKSYRDRINERFKNVKEKAGKSTKKANVFKEAAEKILLEKVKRESSDIDAELELMRDRLKLGKAPENSDVYEFFCREKCHEASEEEKEENFKSTDDLTDGRVGVEFEFPRQCRGVVRSSEDAILFKAKARPVDIIDKIDSEEPRFLEDEGLYVTPKPKLPIQHVHILEQRLSRDHKKWFNCDGELNIIENPCQEISYRPHLKHLLVDEVATYLPAKIEDTECEEIVVVRENLLQLQISSLKFTHHPLFSLEHVLAQKLKKLYTEYEESVLKNDLTRLTRRVEGLRKLLKHWEDTSSQSGDQSDREDGKMEAYRRDIKELQEQVFQEGKKERDRVRTMLQTWKAVKKVRETNKYANTLVRLIIKKEKINYEEDKENFERTFEETYEDFLDYNREKSRRKRQDEDEIREELQERFKESFRAPGEPILYFTLTNDNEVNKSIDNTKETSRRNVVASTKVALKIICNKMEVCRTKWVNLQDDFTCNFDETISIQLISVPKSITVEIIEQPKSLIKRTVGELALKIPAKTLNEKKKIEATFDKDETVHYKHEGVGSGLKMDSLVHNLGLPVNEDDILNTSGCLVYSLTWDSSTQPDENSPESARRILNEIIDKNGSVDPEKLSHWMQQHKPDPLDPRNSILYEYAFDSNEDIIAPNTPKKYFRLNHQMEGWQFCDPKILEDNLRLKVLQLRNRNEPEFDRMMVPNRIKEIPLDILSDYKRRIAAEREAMSIEEDDDEEEVEKKRSSGRKHLKQIHIRVFQKCKNSQDNLTFEDVVDEKLLPQLEKLVTGLVAGFIRWFQWRPLKPLPETKTSKQNDYDLQSQVKVVINVISGLNIPVQREGKNEVVNPFVEAEYNDKSVRTLTSQGPHPSWNEKLVLPLEPSHLDYLNPNSLNGTIIINLFDESDKVLLRFGGEKGKNWLGSVEIPLSAICFNGLQGMFKVKTPYLLFGYGGKTQAQNKSSRNNTQPTQQTYLNLHISIEPNVPKLNPAVEDLPCADLPYIKEHCLLWNEDFNTRYPHRKFSVFAIDTNATTTCIVRYIKPLEPPQINVEGFDVTPEQCARFVSLIPFTDCNEFYKNIWLPTEKFLHFMIGSIIDHAVALTCYLLALKMEVWLLLGFGVPYGSTAFVLVKEYDNNQIPVYYLFDVVQGAKINLTDAFCPLQKVYCVVNEQNIWGNIQRNDDVSTMRFDLTRRFDWVALFNNQNAAPTTSIQGIITYLPKPITDELEIIVDRKIRKRVAKMRQLDRTIWNHHVSNTVKGILSAFEKTEMYGKSNSDVFDEIKKLTKICVDTFSIQPLLTHLRLLNE
ncbi:coiled-coil and C2 domain-containing protein 2A isoform X2 [Zophobas morio]|uniref:coiled-coil and C2 domain-containing protein 2A isoform X2 n=1 Tax=Zophobas morio TaxID=2755281 RepID=UPI003083A67B